MLTISCTACIVSLDSVSYIVTLNIEDLATIMSRTTNLKIGELAKQTGIAVGTLRYYSDLGLLHPVFRGDNGYRYYSQNAGKQVEFIKKAQAIGFTLEEIKTILDVRDRQSFNQERIMGAMSMPQEDLVSMASGSLSPEREIFIYGDSAEQAVTSLKQAGFRKVAIISGGMAAWKSIGGATEGISA